MTEFILKIEDQSIIDKVKNYLMSLPGVSISPKGKRKRKTGIQEALDDVAAGRVTTYESVDEMFQKLGIKI